MKRLILLSWLWLSVSMADTFLVYDDIPYPYPKSYRTSLSKIPHAHINLDGLRSLKMLGSGAFTIHQLKQVIKEVNKPLFVVDLRRESHAYLNGTPVSWFTFGNWDNRHVKPSKIKHKESILLNELIPNQIIHVYKVIKDKHDIYYQYTHPVPLKQLVTEEALLDDLNIPYKRLYVSNHMAPEASQVQNFIDLMAEIPKDSWVYFHCRAGRGRTTTAMIMYDMWHNAHKISFNDIIKRQEALGGANLTTLKSPSDYRHKHYVTRWKFLQAFYQYAKEKPGIPWKRWHQLHRAKPNQFV